MQESSAEVRKLEGEEPLDSRYEILFLYDVEEGNPNGDPMNENKPRVDERSGENLVTDDRLKRTVRDHWLRTLDSDDGDAVFVRSMTKDDGKLKDRKEIAADALDAKGAVEVSDTGKIPKDVDRDIVVETLMETFLDLRTFGATLSVPRSGRSNDLNIGQNGPVQFKIGRSLHAVDTRYFQHSTTLPSDSEQEQGSMADRYNLPYSLIQFYGVVNENAAEKTGMSPSDLGKLTEALWDGTKGLITRSKMAHQPKLLLMVEYERPDYHIGRLDSHVDFESDKLDDELRSFSDLALQFDDLRDILAANEEAISGIYWHTDHDVELDTLAPRDLDVDARPLAMGV